MDLVSKGFAQEVFPGQPSELPEEEDSPTLPGKMQEALDSINQKEIYWGKRASDGKQDLMNKKLKKDKATSKDLKQTDNLNVFENYFPAVCAHVNCNYIATGYSDKTVRLWVVQTGECMCVFAGHRGMVVSLAMSPDGRYMASGDEDGAIMMWDLATTKCVSPLLGHMGSVWSLAFSGEGSLLALGSADNTLRLWDINASSKASRRQDEDVYSFFEPEPSDLCSNGKLGDSKYPRIAAKSNNKVLAHSKTFPISSSDHILGKKEAQEETEAWEGSSVLDLKGENYFSSAVGRKRSVARYSLGSTKEVIAFFKEIVKGYPEVSHVEKAGRRKHTGRSPRLAKAASNP